MTHSPPCAPTTPSAQKIKVKARKLKTLEGGCSTLHQKPSGFRVQLRLEWDREDIRRAASLKGKRVPRRSLARAALDARALRRMGSACEALAPKTMPSPLLFGSIQRLVLFDWALPRMGFFGRRAGIVFGW